MTMVTECLRTNYGDSIRLGESQNRGKGGIGRFGVGLTHASLSQCRRVDIYSWKRPGVVLQVHLDLDSVVDSDGVCGRRAD